MSVPKFPGIADELDIPILRASSEPSSTHGNSGRAAGSHQARSWVESRNTDFSCDPAAIHHLALEIYGQGLPLPKSPGLTDGSPMARR